MANSSGGAQHSKIVAMLGLGAAIFVGVTWILPKFERHKDHLLGFDLNPYIHPWGSHHGHHHGHHHHPGMHHHMADHPGSAAASASAEIYDTPAISPVAHMQGTHGQRDYNLAGLAIEGDLGINGIQ